MANFRQPVRPYQSRRNNKKYVKKITQTTPSLKKLKKSTAFQPLMNRERLFIPSNRKEFLEYLVYGFVKDIAQTIDSNLIIPIDIINSCLIWYPTEWVNIWLNKKLTKTLTAVLNKINTQNFTKTAEMTMNIINEFAETKEDMNCIISLILNCTIRHVQPLFVCQYAELCRHIQNNLSPSLDMFYKYEWVTKKDGINIFRKILIQKTNEIFAKHTTAKVTTETKKEFFSVMILVAELYNVDLLKKNLIFKGVCEALLPPGNKKNFNEIVLEGLCILFRRSGKKLDNCNLSKRYVDKYLQKLTSHARKFGFRMRVIVDQIREMRQNGWNTGIVVKPVHGTHMLPSKSKLNINSYSSLLSTLRKI